MADVLRAFLAYPDEARLIGRMLAGYADLEIDLMNCVKSVHGDLDRVLKVMFRIRGNSPRINVADALARQDFRSLGLSAQYEAAIGAVRYCLRIRNLYAHCTWWDDNTGQLAFANLEELANDDEHLITNLRNVTIHHVSVPHLSAQFDYFEYADNLLIWLTAEATRLKGGPVHPAHALPAPMAQAQLYL